MKRFRKSKIGWRRAVQVFCLAVFLTLFFYVAWPYSATFGPNLIPDKERVALELFLWLDPLAGISTALA
ncbi:MAG: hypothetical protein N3D11_16415, partial [Candidatus Sumerlaeia bacterium]|nr:hypothetical protein [Candidatus Sumerlaeia bacterium]